MLPVTSGLSQAQPKAERGRDLAQLMPAEPMLYFEMDHKNLTKEFLGLIKGSALSDYAAFRDTLYKNRKLEAVDASFFDFKTSAIYAFVLAPEFLDELGRMNGHALAITDITVSALMLRLRIWCVCRIVSFLPA